MAKQMEKRIRNYITKSAKAWERGDHKKENYYAAKLGEYLKPHDIKLDWPGLYPTFTYKGIEHYNIDTLLNSLFIVKLED